jgi:hypothetical protein
VKLLDDKDFMQMVKEYELTRKNVNKELAGTFSFLNIAYYKHAYFLGANKSQHRYPLINNDGRIAVLECECCIPGCAPLLAEVVVEDEVITWRNFGLRHIAYEGFGPFTFNRYQYESELIKVENMIAKNPPPPLPQRSRKKPKILN